MGSTVFHDSQDPCMHGGNKFRVEWLPDNEILVHDGLDAELALALEQWQRAHDWYAHVYDGDERALAARYRDDERWACWAFYIKLAERTGWWPAHARVTGGAP